jgi:hypothetical protein
MAHIFGVFQRVLIIQITRSQTVFDEKKTNQNPKIHRVRTPMVIIHGLITGPNAGKGTFTDESSFILIYAKARKYCHTDIGQTMDYCFWSFALTLIFLIIWVPFAYSPPQIEGFISGPCPNCGHRDPMRCSECVDCGWCVTPNGYGECVPGNEDGPYFRRDCVQWIKGPVRRPPPTPVYRRWNNWGWWRR